MRLDDLRNLVNAMEGMDGQIPVLFMSQPEWPFENSIKGYCLKSNYNEEAEDDSGKEAIVLLEGEQLCYGTEEAWNHCQG